MILATNNKEEIKNILNNFEIYGLKESGINIDVEEDQKDFYGNALKKAKEIYKITNKPTIADDSGLCIDIYNDWPGVMTHRFLGDEATDIERNNAILEKMKDLNGKDRKAKVICCLVYYDGKDILVSEGVLEGCISINRRGENGFGFDEIFELSNGKTLAELTACEKNKISARSLAAQDLNKKLLKNKVNY